ncbi:MAG: type II toxin-antitoxin system HipA family toxin, partial [Candidatus Brocadiales bacterium]|nr:type II toxin-antitoxin system HipA family toxin [Candidatus Brocadiales bacterium]
MSLTVLYRDQIVGTLSLNSRARMIFNYDPNWLRSSIRFPISTSIPFSGKYIQGKDDHNFFANLLPEAGAREGICRSLGISRDNDYNLLSAIGGECAGALRIIPKIPEAVQTESYEAISEEILEKAIKTHIPYTGFAAAGKLRLSLAGAQDKWPVLYRDNQLFWPLGNSPSSHILKFTNQNFKGLNWNEAYTSFLALNLGLPVIDVIVKQDYTLTKRYDRIVDHHGDLQRLHQEDFCQALGYSPFTKYEAEGGPNLKICIELIRSISIAPAEDVVHLLNWHIFNLLAGNSDGHAKNLSILYTQNGPRLAPFYDLVCTRIYPDISSDLAFSVGASHDPGHIQERDWQNLANQLEINPR